MRLHLYLGTKDQDLICFQNRIKNIQGITLGRIVNDMISAYIKNEVYILPFQYEGNEDRLVMANKPVNLSIFLDAENEQFLSDMPERGKNHFIKEIIRTNLNRAVEPERKLKPVKRKIESASDKSVIKTNKPKNRPLDKEDAKPAIIISAPTKKELKTNIQIAAKEPEDTISIDEKDKEDIYDDVEDNLIALSGADEY